MTKPSTCAGPLFVNVSMPFAGMRLVPDSCYLAIELSVATATSGSRIDVRGSIVMRSHKSHGSGLMPTISALPGARRADVSGFGVPEHPDNGRRCKCSSKAAISASKLVIARISVKRPGQ